MSIRFTVPPSLLPSTLSKRTPFSSPEDSKNPTITVNEVPSSSPASSNVDVDVISTPVESPVIPPKSKSAEHGPVEDRLAGSSAPAGFIARLKFFEDVLDRKIGVEGNGAASGRTGQSMWVMALLWASGTMNLGVFATGFLGWGYGLDLQTSVLVVVLGTFLGSLVTAWCATLGMFRTFFCCFLEIEEKRVKEVGEERRWKC